MKGIQKERFTDIAWTQGDFNKSTISCSQTTLSNWMYFLKYHLSKHLEFKREADSISFNAGTFVHDYFQAILIGIYKIEDVEAKFRNFIKGKNYAENDKAKAEFLADRIVGYVQNHLDAVKEISGKSFPKGWDKEKSFSDWYDDQYMKKTLGVACEGYIDCFNDEFKMFSEHKNRFGSVKKNPNPLTQKKKPFTYVRPQKINSPQFTHCIQVAVYSKHFNHNYKPHLIYGYDDHYKIFDAKNCWELSPEGINYFFNKFIQINIQRQEMLRIADGSIKKLAMMIGIDWSDIRHYKRNFMLKSIDEGDIKKLENFYENL